MSRTPLIVASAVLVATAACTARVDPAAVAPPSTAPTTATTTSTMPSAQTTVAGEPAEPPSSTATAPLPANTSAPPTTAPTTTIAITTTGRPSAMVTAPGPQGEPGLAIHLGFRSEVDDFTSQAVEAIAMAALADPRGWGQAGFEFIVDETSDLTVVLAEPRRVDELCRPLLTRGAASCQNGPIVALNAELWRNGSDDWDTTVADYRTYLVNHEVGHLIGLRHPQTRCPSDAPRSAVMEPQTGGLVCPGNGWPLDWEIEWASNRPAEIGPPPEWDGPRPVWGL